MVNYELMQYAPKLSIAHLSLARTARISKGSLTYVFDIRAEQLSFTLGPLYAALIGIQVWALKA